MNPCLVFREVVCGGWDDEFRQKDRHYGSTLDHPPFLIPPLVLVGYAEEPKVAPADRQSTDEDLKDFQDFTAARGFWFKTTASQGEISPSAEFQHVFIVIMDWPINGKQTLVLAAADGTSSLCISPGPKVLGGHSAKEEAKAVIAEAEKILALAQKVSEHPLSPPGEVRFYIRTYSVRALGITPPAPSLWGHCSSRQPGGCRCFRSVGPNDLASFRHSFIWVYQGSCRPDRPCC